MSEERWLPVVGYEGLYEVSDQGRVRSVDHVDTLGRHWKGKELTAGHTKSNHVTVSLSKFGRPRSWYVHRLVLEAFVGTAPEGTECCHYNDIPDDNRLENLRWDTSRNNKPDIVRNGNNHNASKTHCKRGHVFDTVNTFIHTDGRRECKLCMKRKSALRQHNRRRG